MKLESLKVDAERTYDRSRKSCKARSPPTHAGGPGRRHGHTRLCYGTQNRQIRFKFDTAPPTYNRVADAVGLVSTQRVLEEAVKAVLDVQEEEPRIKEE